MKVSSRDFLRRFSEMKRRAAAGNKTRIFQSPDEGLPDGESKRIGTAVMRTTYLVGPFPNDPSWRASLAKPSRSGEGECLHEPERKDRAQTKTNRRAYQPVTKFREVLECARSAPLSLWLHHRIARPHPSITQISSSTQRAQLRRFQPNNFARAIRARAFPFGSFYAAKIF
jgi:hypothetical protein